MTPLSRRALFLITFSDILLISFLLVWFLGIPFLNRSLIYQPESGFNENLLTEYELEEHWVPSSEGNLHAIYKDQNPNHLVLFFHGNTGNISVNEPNIKYLEAAGTSYFMVDYPGFGKSQGTPTEDTLYEAAELSYKYATENLSWEPENITINGQSLGGAVAIDLAAKVPSKNVIIESSFPSLKSVAEHIYPSLPISLLLREDYDSLSKVKKITSPILFLHGAEDEILPVSFSEELFRDANEPKYFLELPGLGHNNVKEYTDIEFTNIINEFLFESKFSN